MSISCFVPLTSQLSRIQLLNPYHQSHSEQANMAPPFLKTPEEYRQLVDSVDTFLLDCDGVIYHGPEVVEGVKEVLTMFRAAGAFLLYQSPEEGHSIGGEYGCRLIIRQEGHLRYQQCIKVETDVQVHLRQPGYRSKGGMLLTSFQPFHLPGLQDTCR